VDDEFPKLRRVLEQASKLGFSISPPTEGRRETERRDSGRTASDGRTSRVPSAAVGVVELLPVVAVAGANLEGTGFQLRQNVAERVEVGFRETIVATLGLKNELEAGTAAPLQLDRVATPWESIKVVRVFMFVCEETYCSAA